MQRPLTATPFPFLSDAINIDVNISITENPSEMISAPYGMIAMCFPKILEASKVIKDVYCGP